MVFLKPVHLPHDLLLKELDIEGSLLVFTLSDSDGGLVEIRRLSGRDWGLCTRVLSFTEGAAVV